MPEYSRKFIALAAAFQQGKYICTEGGEIFSCVQFGPAAGRTQRKRSRRTNNGYRLVTFYDLAFHRIDICVHQAIWIYFCGPYPTEQQINHRNGVKEDNRLENLELVRGSDNIKHAHRLGLINQEGSRNPASKLTEAYVREIRAAAVDGATAVDLSKQYGVTPSNILQVIHRRTWRHI